MTTIYLRKYGEETTIPLTLFESDGVNFRADAVYVSGDVKITKNEAAETNTTNAFVDNGSKYSIVLTATEMQAARISLIVIDQDATKLWLDTDIVIDTYGNASAQHAFDLDEASAPQTADNNVILSSLVVDIWAESTRELTSGQNIVLAKGTGITGFNDITVNEILTTQMTESYASNGTAPTLSQGVFAIQQNLTDFAYNGVTQTVRKLDGTTTAATYTLDSETAPTSKTRSG